jgi:hypothetical protein
MKQHRIDRVVSRGRHERISHDTRPVGPTNWILFTQNPIPNRRKTLRLENTLKIKIHENQDPIKKGRSLDAEICLTTFEFRAPNFCSLGFPRCGSFAVPDRADHKRRVQENEGIEEDGDSIGPRDS